MKTLSVKVSDDVYQAFAEVAKKLGLTPTQLLKQLVLETIKNELNNDSISSLHTYRDKVMELEERVKNLEAKVQELEKTLRSALGLLAHRKK